MMQRGRVQIDRLPPPVSSAYDDDDDDGYNGDINTSIRSSSAYIIYNYYLYYIIYNINIYGYRERTTPYLI